MGDPSWFGTLLDASTCKDGFEASTVGLREGRVRATLVGISTGSLNNYHIRAKATRWAATIGRHVWDASCTLMLATCIMEVFTSTWIPSIAHGSTLHGIGALFADSKFNMENIWILDPKLQLKLQGDFLKCLDGWEFERTYEIPKKALHPGLW
jgi:hypothetical protein